jgi:isopenicillin-N epimerase
MRRSEKIYFLKLDLTGEKYSVASILKLFFYPFKRGNMPIKELFQLDPNVIYLNHGSFGACPKPVFEIFQHWQRELERQPFDFLSRRATILMEEARSSLAVFLNVASENVVYFPNPTTAVNMVARNLDLQPGDEILTSNHEYGAMIRTFNYIADHTGVHFIQYPIELPLSSQDEFVERFWRRVNPRTKVIFLSHITSCTALIFPVKTICQKAREHGILTIIDGAHAPGQIPLDLTDIGADIYTGACHKWLCAPKGSAFLYASPQVQSWLDPLVVSWGYQSINPSNSRFIDYHEWQGTRDLSAFLSVPAAIRFQQDHHWDKVRAASHSLASQTRRRIQSQTGLVDICPDSSEWYSQMFSAPLPDDISVDQLMKWLYEKHHIEVLAPRWNEKNFIRVSVQGYNDPPQLDILITALGEALSSH